MIKSVEDAYSIANSVTTEAEFSCVSTLLHVIEEAAKKGRLSATLLVTEVQIPILIKLGFGITELRRGKLLDDTDVRMCNISWDISPSNCALEDTEYEDE